MFIDGLTLYIAFTYYKYFYELSIYHPHGFICILLVGHSILLTMLDLLKIIALFLVETFLLAMILNTFSKITPDSTGESVLLIGLYAVGMIGLFLAFIGLGKKLK